MKKVGEDGLGKAVFLTKAQREELALQRLQQKREEEEKKKQEVVDAHRRFVTGQTIEDKRREERIRREKEDQERQRRQREENIGAAEQKHEMEAIKEHYLGVSEKKSNFVKPSEKTGRVFQFEWKAEDDTGKDDLNPLYSKRQKIAPLFGRGYLAGVDQREQRKESNFLIALSEKRVQEARKLEESDTSISEAERKVREDARNQALERFRRNQAEEGRKDNKADDQMGYHWSEKTLAQMTERDWRIFREDFDIRVQGGGRNTLPLRYWSEAALPTPLVQAIQAAGYEKPSPIQRQTIPIGLAKRDIIGIAETGSGKTCAFLVPLLAYILQLPQYFRDRVADQGPLAIVMAPTRELAEQIEKECKKLASFTELRVLSVVGGRDIEEQKFEISKGVDIVIGTPGRILDCISRHYLVLNQCNYVVLDEADRMIDMGFDEQVEEVLNQMGGLLRPEHEDPNQMIEDDQSSTMYRTTAMFTATMSPEIEVIAKQYLRHPVLVRIGDVDSGKNRRIEQKVMFLASEAAKKNALLDEINRSLRSQPSSSSSAAPASADVKIIVFVNTQKAADTICRQLEEQRHRVGVLHGGKSQEVREETLEDFRASKINILVATDVAGRGLDIPDVSHVINVDCPKKIANYCHRIGRTGRAGKFGTAVTFITDADTEVMYDLKQYLESTDAMVPHQLAHHPAAQAAPGTRDDKGRLVGQKRDRTMFTN
jgi:ATP-dependent RNA helicase DDX23/PRP28